MSPRKARVITASVAAFMCSVSTVRAQLPRSNNGELKLAPESKVPTVAAQPGEGPVPFPPTFWLRGPKDGEYFFPKFEYEGRFVWPPNKTTQFAIDFRLQLCSEKDTAQNGGCARPIVHWDDVPVVFKWNESPQGLASPTFVSPTDDPTRTYILLWSTAGVLQNRSKPFRIVK